MNVVQNYDKTNYQFGNNKAAFKANISTSLKNELLREVKPAVRERYSAKLMRRLNNIPEDVTIQDIIQDSNGFSYINLKHGDKSKTYILCSEGSKLDVVESLLRKPKNGTITLSEIAYKFFGI